MSQLILRTKENKRCGPTEICNNMRIPHARMPRAGYKEPNNAAYGGDEPDTLNLTDFVISS